MTQSTSNAPDAVDPTTTNPNTRDESPIDLGLLHRQLPNWLRRFIPKGGGQAEDHHGKGMFGVTVFLLSESLIFVSFFASYVTLRLTTPRDVWIPAGTEGPSLTGEVIFNTVVLVSSSFVIYFAERALRYHKLNQFRLLWLTTSAMGIYFLVGEVKEWSGLDFGLSTGLVGGTFYILTGFHGLHVLTGVILQMVMLGRSFRAYNYENSHFGVSAVALFWHFVDVIWVGLFSLIYLW